MGLSRRRPLSLSRLYLGASAIEATDRTGANAGDPVRMSSGTDRPLLPSPDDDPRTLRIPGPTPVPPDVIEAMRRPMIPHRGPAFKVFYPEVLRLARLVHRTDGDVFTWPASGSAGWEVAVVNLLSPGDPVLATVNGDFGVRFANVAATFGLDVRRLEVPWGRAITPALLHGALEKNP